MTTDRFQYLLDLTIALTKKELKSKYKSTTFGFLWLLINPLLQMSVLTIVFLFFIKITIPNYSLFVFSGLLPWMFFSQAIQTATASLILNRDILKKISFQKELLPISAVIAQLYIFSLTLPIIIFWSILSQGISTYIFLLLPVIALQVLLITGMSLILSSLDVYYRDISFALTALLFPLFYLTPVLYPISYVPDSLTTLYKINPLVGLISSYQAILVNTSYFDSTALTYSICITAIVVIYGFYIFKKRSIYFGEWI